MNEELDKKICLKCDEPKPLDDYCNHPEGKLGLQPYCKSCVNKMVKAYYQDNIENEREKGRIKYWKYRERCHRLRQELKLRVLTHYGGGRCACVGCRFDDLRALSIDHINGNGRREGKSGIALYEYLKKHNYPDGYQTLCMNCQYIKRFENKEHNNGGRTRIKS